MGSSFSDPGILVPCPEGPVDWPALFGNGHPVAVEVGVGKGVFLERLAAADPGTNLVGIEIRKKRVEKIVARVARAGLRNVRVLAGDARRIFETAFADGSLCAVYLNFPDPWPKRRHAKRRIFRGAFPRWVHRVLARDGVWHACTDVRSYAEEMIAGVEGLGLFRNLGDASGFSERPPGYPASIHEEKFRAWGRSIYYMAWRKPS